LTSDLWAINLQIPEFCPQIDTDHTDKEGSFSAEAETFSLLVLFQQGESLICVHRCDLWAEDLQIQVFFPQIDTDHTDKDGSSLPGAESFSLLVLIPAREKSYLCPSE
jgi:hypothetical protein